MANDIDKTSPHYKGEYGSIYEVNQKFPNGGVAGDYVEIDGWAHYWNADRGTWCVNAQRDSYWDELITGIIEKFKLFKGATYMGVAGLDTVPAKAIGAKMYYFATVAGTYKNFGGLVVPQGINVLYSENGSSWVCSTLLEVAQELGVSTNKVVSQKALNDALELKANQSAVNEALAKKADKETVNIVLGKKFDKTSVAQEPGDSEELVMSQKAVSSKLSEISIRKGYTQDGNGNAIADDNFSLSPFIRIPAGCTSLTWNTGGKLDNDVYQNAFLCEFDANKQFISNAAWFTNQQNRTFNFDGGESTRYIRFPVLNDNLGKAYIENLDYGLQWSFSGANSLRQDTFTFGYGLSAFGKAVKDKDFILSPMIEIPNGCTSFDWHIGTSLDDKKYLNAFLCEFDEFKTLVDAWFSKSGSTATNRVVTLNARTKYVRFPIFNSNIGDSWIENKEYNLYCGFDVQKIKMKEINYYDDTYYCLRNLNKTKIDEKTGSSDTSYKPLVLLHFADIHNDDVNLQRVVDFLNIYNNNLDDVFLNGDIAGGTWNEYSDAFNKVLINNKILCSIGNHDVYKYNGTEAQATAKQCYDRYFANIANWGVTEPNANSGVGNCYYYKDYPSSGIRFIVLDCMHYDTEQNNWLKATLADALSSKKSVIAAQHIAVANPSSTEVTIPYDTPFNSIDHKDDSTSDNGQVTAIEDFINNGGEFITWLFGHTHSSFCGKLKIKKQNYIIVGGAKFDVNWNDTVRNSGDYSRDLFDVMSFDTKSKTISVKRIGANYDRFMRKRNAMCIDYANFKLLSTN